MNEHNNYLYEDLNDKHIIRKLIDNKIKLSELSRSKRISNRSFYIASLRNSRNTCNLLIDDLKLLLQDIPYVNNPKLSEELLDILSVNIKIMELNYNGDKTVNDFKKTIPNKILQKMLL